MPFFTRPRSASLPILARVERTERADCISYMRYSVGVKTPMYLVPVVPPAQNCDKDTRVCEPMPSICTAGRFKGPKVPVCVGLTEGPKAPLTVMPLLVK